MTLSKFFFAAFIFGVVSAPTAQADGDYVNHPRAKILISRLVSNHGFTRKQVAAILDEAEQIPELIPKETENAEKVKPWHEYRRQFVHPLRIKSGVEFMRKYSHTLARAEKEFGVPPEVITGIIGVETVYGKLTGNIRVLDALATQGFEHPTRADFFLDELEAFFVLCRQQRWDAEDLKGSYAGAMGTAQFMPSNYLKLALDYDHNGELDLWDPQDAIGSIANYFAKYRGEGLGWMRGAPVAFPAHAEPARLGLIPRNGKTTDMLFGRLWEAGLRPVGAPQDVLQVDTPVGLIELEGREALEYWVALNNFYVIMSYNPRAKYAMAVYQLSQGIREAPL
ncbi:MAG: lytic murein transglycosylase B [Nevskiales bacterium]